jgi:hypothetical protein
MKVVEVPVAVVYGESTVQRSHFRRVADPTKIVGTIARTVVELRLRGQ